VDRRVDVGYKNGIQRIYDLSGAHPDVRKFAINYLVEVFDEKGPNGLTDYVVNNFLSSCGGPTPAVRNIMARLARLKAGQKVPDITLNNAQGQPTSLYNSLGSPVTLLLFWGSWCNHCKEENPKILELTRRYRDRGLSVFAIGVENDLNEWRQAVAALGSHWTHVAETNLFNGNTARNFDVKTTPTLFLLDAQGKVLAAHFQPELLENYLGQLFK
jgi:thiol-disulfide isomerase/thioredoxin